MKHTTPCPKCRAKGKIEIDENLLGEKVYVLRCRECGSLSVCQDGIHWNIIMQNNNQNSKNNEVTK